VEASALQAPATLPQTRVAVATPLLRLRSDEQLVALFRAGHDEAFRAIHDRYHKRLFAYARQMLPARQDAEDALQDVFVRAYAGLRASNQDLALRAWLFRVAHNRCIDELRRPAPPPPEVLQLVRTVVHDPLVEVDLRESVRRLIEDIRRLPEQQRSALLMRELAGMSYVDLSVSLGISVGAVKSLLVRARVSLVESAEARDTSCQLIREQLVEAHDRGLRPCATARKHMRDCVGCKSFRRELRGISRQLAAVAPAVGPLAVLAKTLGFSKAGGGAAGGGGLAILGGGGATASTGGLAVGVNHVATLLVAAVAATGGAVELQHTIIAPTHHPSQKAAPAAPHHQAASEASAAAATPTAIQAIAGDVEATASTAPKLAASADLPVAGHLKARVRRPMTSDAAFGGPVSGDYELSRSSSTTGGTSTATNSEAPAESTSSCATPVSSTSSTTGTATSQSSASTGTQTPASTSSSAVAPTSCATSSTPSTGTASSSTNSAQQPTSNQSTSGTATSGDTSTSGSPSGGDAEWASASGSWSTGGSAAPK
jgi:RNA polymerase sigma factor (sigma-70 family)